MTHDEMEQAINANTIWIVCVVVLIVLLFLLTHGCIHSAVSASHALHHPNCTECYSDDK